jgi:twitching motility protein PilT
MNLSALVSLAATRKASDIHIETGLPVGMRINGRLIMADEKLSDSQILKMVSEVVGHGNWESFKRRRSYDVAKTIANVRCRINALHSMRGVGLAIRLLPALLPSISSLNLHPSLQKLTKYNHGLILMSGPTGCGKSSTLAALINEINQTRPSHIVTIEEPIEYYFPPERAFIRQREVGRDTPTFEQALIDAMREDPDVIMVGELREPECMRLTLNAAETGHLVLATVHSSTVAEALQRIVLAFPAEIQAGISSQLADCLQAVICQRLHYNSEIDLNLPECEILIGNSASRAVVRQGDFFKLGSVLETGGQEGMFSKERYKNWLSDKTDWQRFEIQYSLESSEVPQPVRHEKPRPKRRAPVTKEADQVPGVLEIDAPDQDLESIVAEIGGKTPTPDLNK